jgi:hypothetical protein
MHARLAPALVLILLLCPRLRATDAAPNPAYRGGFETIEKRALRSWLGFLASPELEGRQAASRGHDVASRYVASVLEGLGVAPGGEGGSYYQPFSLVRRQRPAEGAFLTLKAPGGEAERIPLAGELAVAAAGAIDWRCPWVFAGFGEGAECDGPDDLQGLPLDGRAVLILPRSESKCGDGAAAVARGAKRLAIVSDARARRQGSSRPLPQYRIDEEQRGAGGVETVYIPRALADRILGRFGLSTAELAAASQRPRGFPLDGLEIELSIEQSREELRTQNVIGVVEGSDPALRREAVVVGAHLDHVGKQEDKVFHGADDNASGCAALLAIGRALVENPRPPRRTVLLVFFSGEEMGLHGSRFFADHPTIPIDDIVLMVNLDMVGRNEEHPSSDPEKAEKAEDNANSLHVVGSKLLSLELDPWAQRVNQLAKLDFEYDEEERVLRRSDHFSFAQKGIPVVFFFTGFHPDYHQPTDTIEKINFEKLTRISRLTYALVFEVADRERRLRVNRF